MKRTAMLLCAGFAMASCDGNPFGTDGGGGGGTPGGGTTPGGLTIPQSLLGDLGGGSDIRFVKGASPDQDRLTVNMMFTGNPQTVQWVRPDTQWLRDQLDVRDPDGRRTYIAFVRQDDALDRAFLGYGNESPDGSVRAAVAADGGQFNRIVTGAAYDRTGGFQRPTNSETGMVSYAGTYAGVSNAPSDPTLYPHPVTLPSPHDTNVREVLLPYQGTSVRGQVFLNADFRHNRIEGAIEERYQTQVRRTSDGTGVESSTIRLENIILVRTEITQNGTFQGIIERDSREPWRPPNTAIGEYGGVIGGAQAGNLAGVIAFNRGELFWGEDVRLLSGPVPSEDDVVVPGGSRIDPGAEERGIFVIGRCDGSSAAPECSVVRP